MNASLLSDVIDDYANDAPRLAYADWLESQGGSEAAEFVRVQLEAARLDPSRPGFAAFLDRVHRNELQLWRKTAMPPPYEVDVPKGVLHVSLGRDWDFARGSNYRRGFPYVAHEPINAGDDDEGEQAAAQTFRDAIPGILDRTTLRGMNFDGAFSRQLDTILQAPRIAEFDSLAIDSLSGADGDGVRTVLSSQIVTSLRALELREVIGDAQLHALAKEVFPNLRRLELRFPDRKGNGLEALLTSDLSRGIEDLSIGLEPAQAERLLPTLSQFPQLGALRLWDTPLDTVPPLAKTAFGKLGWLSFRASSLASAGMKVLADWPMPHLKSLSVGGCGIKIKAVKSLVAAAWAPGLEALDLDSNRIDDKALAVLARAESLFNLRHLALSYNNLTTQGLPSLAREGVFPHLTMLDLRSPEHKTFAMNPAEMLEFANGLALPNLTRLYLGGWKMGDEAVIALAANPSLANLVELNLAENAITEKGARALFRSPYLKNLLQLELSFNPIAEALPDLADQALLPNLTRIVLDSKCERQLGAERLEALRRQRSQLAGL